MLDFATVTKSAYLSLVRPFTDAIDAGIPALLQAIGQVIFAIDAFFSDLFVGAEEA